MHASSNFASEFNSIPNERGFKMALLNIVSLPKHFDEIKLSLSNQLIDLMAFNETRLDPTITDDYIKVNGYDVIRKDRSRTGGGVCIYLRSTINYRNRSDLVPLDLEAVCLEIIKPHSRPFIVASVYRPPNSSPEFFISFENLIKAVDNENKELHILGDLNGDLLKVIPDQPTKKLISLYELYQLSQLINEATRITATSATLLDHFITSNTEKITTSGVIHTGISDHSLIFGIRKINIREKKKANIIEVRNMKRFNDQYFLEDLMNQPWEQIYFFADNPDRMWQIWKQLFLVILDTHAPLQHKKIKPCKVPWLTNNIKKLIITRNKLKHKAINTNLEADWQNFKKARNDTNIEIRNVKKEYYSRRIAGQKSDPKEAWKTINSLLGRKTKLTTVNELSLDGKNMTDFDEIADGFNKYFSNVGPDLARSIGTSDYNFENYIKKTNAEFSGFNTINTSNICHLLNSLSKSKATGIDKISSKILKIASPVISGSLTYIFNQSIVLSSFPNEWKMARVTPIYKNGQRNLPGNYRPISVLPVISKIMERILYEQLHEYLTKNDLLSKNQFGFRRLHSTATALLDCTNSWYVNMDRKMFNLVVFIDLKKAFDTVDHKILLRKLELYGIKGNALSLIKSYLSDRIQKCQVNGVVSSGRPVKCGIPQGSILGPLFFLLYINDLPECLIKTNSRLFADDTNLTATGETINEVEIAMNLDLENLRKWLQANKLSLNVAKTEFLLIGSKSFLRSRLDRQPDIFIEKEKVKQVFESKSLGVVVDQHLSWKSNTDKICKKITSGIAVLKRLRDFVDKGTLRSVYHALIQPHFDYCREVWDVFGASQSKRLQKLHNRSARIIMNMSNDVDHTIALSSLGWESLEVQRKKAKAKLMFKLLNKLGPKSLTKLFTKKCEVTKYDLRNSSTSLHLPQPRTNKMKKSFMYDGAVVWNSLRSEVRECKSLSSFQNKIAAHAVII